MKRLFGLFLLVASVALVSLCFGFAKNQMSEAASSSEFKTGRLIDDIIFVDNDAMSPAEIRDFINSKVSSCATGVTCLRDYYENPSTKENNLDGRPIPAGAVPAYQIIWQAAQDHLISPKVLLVTLQKETSLVTMPNPGSWRFRTAMGYGCPDTAPCDAQYYGFYNQVNKAAWQFRRYLTYPQNYNFAVGNRFIQYHPNSGCGGSTVSIETASTAALYNYTPYQPNQAALNNLYGTGDSCSSYGNRNFWRTFSDWFGNPTVDPNKDQLLVGDWDGDGLPTTGVRRGNMYYLDNDNDGDADWEYGFGIDSDVHLVGDWDGDDSDEIGLKRGERYYFSTDFNGTAEIYQGFGNPSDQALVGDWDGDNRDEIGLKRGERYYLNFDYDGNAEIYQGFGNPSDQALVGDWDGDDRDSIGLKRGRHFYLNNNYDGAAEIYITYNY